MKWIIKRTALLAAVFLGCAFGLLLSFAQPLVPSRDYVVTANLNGKPIPAKVLHPLALPGTYYIHLPDARPQLYSWFCVAFPQQSVFLTGGPETICRGIRYMRVDQIRGLRLTNPKIEDHWSVTFTSDGVQFTNTSLSVTLKRDH